MDKICMLDGAATTLLSIQYNLAAGTLAPFALKRPELRPLLEKILRFDVSYVILYMNEIEREVCLLYNV